jgi:hypothetical protein
MSFSCRRELAARHTHPQDAGGRIRRRTASTLLAVRISSVEPGGLNVERVWPLQSGEQGPLGMPTDPRSANQIYKRSYFVSSIGLSE